MPLQIPCQRDVRIFTAVLLAGVVVGKLLAQNPPQLPKPSTDGVSIDAAARAAVHDRGIAKETAQERQRIGSVEILSDTEGVDFHPYIKEITATIRYRWYSLTPHDMKYGKGKPAIEFDILKDGKISDMKLADSAGFELDRPAWDSIRTSTPMPALPESFHGNRLSLRFRFFYNPGLSDLHDLRRGTKATPPL